MKAVPSQPRAAESLRTASMVGLTYLIVGTLWILWSDGLVESMSHSQAWLVTAQRYKGIFYILATTAGLVYLVHRGYQRLLAMGERVARSELRVADLFEHHPQPMWVYDLESYRFLRVNDAALAAYGYSRDGFLAMSANDIRSTADVPGFVAAAEGEPGTGSAPGVFRHRTSEGRTILARISEHLVDLDGRRAVMVMAEDVTEEVGIQEAVNRQQRQFRQLHQSLGEVLWMATPDFQRVTYVSPAFELLYGRRSAELLGNPAVWREAVHPDDVDKVTDLKQAAPDQDSVQSEYRIVRPDGSVRWVEDRKRLIRDESGAVVLVGGIAEDVTARKERDEARDALNSRLEALVAERTAELQLANIELEAFSRTAAHDLKTPLNGIVGMSQLLRMRSGSALDPDGQRCLDQIERSSRDMGTLIDDLLALSHAGSSELHREDVDLAPLVASLIAGLRALEPHRQVEVVLPQRMDLYCDAGLMRSVLQNLLGNAWKFTAGSETARITVTVTHGATESTLTVSDNGAGFDTTQMGPLLRPFQRFHTQAQFQGHGLGLVTCQRIANRHGGRLWLESEPDVGTRASFVLPRR
jgi:PAS domain S-box-containing protein